MDGGIVPEDRQLLVLAHSGSELMEELVDVWGFEGSANLVHLEEAAALLANGSKDSDILLIGPLVRNHLRFPTWGPG